MTVDLLHPRGKSCENCKHISEDETSAQVMIDFGYHGPYWQCYFRSYHEKNEVFPKTVIIYTDGTKLCSSWEPKDKKK